ncbi:MAG: hypothetical protein CBC79_01850 [Gammaproteobacteria bacterium TMED119]|nr:MAG: hypothetical protein CBC79_01850 [Gammaproteobacteria bacterium TMED119]
MVDSTDAAQFFSAEGVLAQNIAGFKCRPQQVAMAESVERSIQDASTLVIEAGTGVGKTYAYLVPALQSGLKIIVSTGTRHLQDQLFYTDLPMLQKASAISIKAAILKGRANYLCHYRLARFEHELSDFPKLTKSYLQIKDWSKVTQTGDLAEVNQLSEQAPIRSHITSTRDNCLGSDCPDYGQCHVVKARKRAQEADLVVINHHLLGADLVIKEEGFGEILPKVDVFILDEAHQFADILPNFFGQTLSSRQLQDFVADVSKESTLAALTVLNKSVYKVLDGVEKFFAALVKQTREPRVLWRELASAKTIENTLALLAHSCLDLEDQLMAVANDSPGLAQCYKRCVEINGILDDFSSAGSKNIQWLELTQRHFKLGNQPLDVASPFQRLIQEYQCAWIYTSATLTANLSFAHFTAQLGLDDAECVMCDSPFDYPKQARLYLPQLPVQPNDPSYTEQVVSRSMPLLQASLGNAFMLFTSYKALYRAADLLRDSAFNILVQGDMPKRELLAQFNTTDNCVLLGTQSFWEGVDVRGQRLRVVIIDKLPFMSPGDPIVQARSRVIQEAGDNPFMVYQVPQAILNLKQGVGRLIRGEQDYGVVALMDPRLTTKAYGKSFLKSLPPMTVCQHEREVVAFLNSIEHYEITRN